MITLENFCTRAPSFLRTNAPTTWDLSDDEMNSKAQMIPAGIVPKAAAVLVGVLENSSPSVLLTQRHGKLSNHAGHDRQHTWQLYLPIMPGLYKYLKLLFLF